MVTKFGGNILATKFGFVPDCSTSVNYIAGLINTPCLKFC